MPTIDPADAAYLATIDPDHDTHAEAAVGVHVLGDVLVRDFPARTLTTDQRTLAAGGPAQQLAPGVKTRASLRIRARGGDVVIGRPEVTATTGYQLAAGDELVLTSTAAVYAVSVAGAVAHILAEHRDG